MRYITTIKNYVTDTIDNICYSHGDELLRWVILLAFLLMVSDLT